MYDKRNKICEMVSNDVKKHFNDKVFKTIIPRNVRISEAPSYGQPVLMYDISCPGSQAYASLAGEIINQRERSKMKQKKNARPIGLGSGLSSLLGAEVEKKPDNFKMIPVELIKPGPWQ